MDCPTTTAPRSADLPRRSRGAHGVTLLETMIVLVIVAIGLASAIPGFSRLLAGHRATGVVGEFVAALQLTRSEALKRGRRVYLAPPTGRWHDGWVVFVDGNDSRAFEEPTGPRSDEAIARHEALGASVTITNPSNATREPFTDLGAPQRPYVMFDAHGFPRQRSGAFHAGSLTVTGRAGQATAVRTLCLAAYGRIRVVVDRTGCST